MDLNGKVALVMGGAIQVGRAISLAFARAGADVVINYNSSVAEAERSEADIMALGRAMPCKADVSKADQVQAMIDATVERFGRLDVLVNSASVWKDTRWPDVAEADWDLLNDVAANAASLNLTYALAIEMAPRVRVNAVAPGAVLPPPGYTAEQIALARKTTLLQRWGSANDVSRTVVFLAESEYITGALIPVDGGEMLAWRKASFYE